MSDVTKELLDPREAGRRARAEYLTQRSVVTGNPEIDSVLFGGVELGQFYLVLGPAKHGKSTFMRCLGLSIAKHHPILMVNMEQLGRTVISKIYSMVYGTSLRNHVHENPDLADLNIESLPDLPFYVAFWTDGLESRAFNVVEKHLKESIEAIAAKDKFGRKPIVILENLTDMYAEGLDGRDQVTNVVTKTAEMIHKFCIRNQIAMFLSHHTAKIHGDEPEMDDVRDSKRVCDLAHSVFASYVRVELDPLSGEYKNKYYLKFISGREQGDTVRWRVITNGINVNLERVKFVPNETKKPKYTLS